MRMRKKKTLLISIHLVRVYDGIFQEWINNFCDNEFFVVVAVNENGKGISLTFRSSCSSNKLEKTSFDLLTNYRYQLK